VKGSEIPFFEFVFQIHEPKKKRQLEERSGKKLKIK